jgi:Tfp pilus assembly protein PilF
VGARALATLILLLVSGGCSVAPPAPDAGNAVWMDQAFGYGPDLVNVSAASLFALDDDLVRSLRSSPEATERGPAARRTYLLTLLFGPDMKAFAYAGGHSTAAAETWRNQRGDCLSLSALSVALARALGLPVQLQEVRVPATFDRRGQVDFLNAHVNVLVRNDQPLRMAGHERPAGDIVIDFEPSTGSRQRGTPLGDAAVLARFLNNLASEHLTQGNERMAYAHFKAAIMADPSYSAGYHNLAQLYLSAGHADAAEALLHRALALDDANALALGSLHRLLLSQGRDAEAQVYERRLLAQREHDPYYWLGLGRERLRQAQYGSAVEALERAQALTTGFGEVHRYLAIAYWHTGQRAKARDQLAVLTALDLGDEDTDRLSRKLVRNADPAR